ncbi:MAG TPA: sigma-70 family RNA polymerase sigma factor, partial [Acidimicrobiales bacterium]
MATRAPLEIPAEDGPERDRALVRRHLEGDAGAFGEIVRRYYPSLLGHARRRLGDRRVAEDVVQEAFLRAYRALPRFGGDYQLGPWLHRITANVCTTEGARRSRELDAQRRWAAGATDDALRPDEYAEHVEALARVLAAIETLPSNYREALVLRDVMDLDYADVADRSGISEQNARARVSRARAALRKIVEPTAAFGAVVGRVFRRGARLAPRFYNQLSTSANAVSEAATMPARASAFTAVATTSVAAMAVAVPFLGGGFTPALPKAGPAQVVAGPNVTSTNAASNGMRVTVASPVEATAAPAATSSTTSTSTSTTSSTVAPVAAVVAPIATTTTSQPAQDLADLESQDIPAAFGQGLSQNPGTLTVMGADPIHGQLVSQLTLPKAGAAACTGSLNGRFWWDPANASSNHQLTLSSSFVSATTDATGATVYDVVGYADVVNGVGAFN